MESRVRIDAADLGSEDGKQMVENFMLFKEQNRSMEDMLKNTTGGQEIWNFERKFQDLTYDLYGMRKSSVPSVYKEDKGLLPMPGSGSRY
jgi:hypothetical protein